MAITLATYTKECAEEAWSRELNALELVQALKRFRELHGNSTQSN